MNHLNPNPSDHPQEGWREEVENDDRAGETTKICPWCYGNGTVYKAARAAQLCANPYDICQLCKGTGRIPK
jgi:DnaJ-class molecular chaperone